MRVKIRNQTPPDSDGAPRRPGPGQANPIQAGAARVPPRRRLRATRLGVQPRRGARGNVAHGTGELRRRLQVGYGGWGWPVGVADFRRGPAAWRLPVYGLLRAAAPSNPAGALSAVCWDSATALSKEPEKNRCLCLLFLFWSTDLLSIDGSYFF